MTAKDLELINPTARLVISQGLSQLHRDVAEAQLEYELALAMADTDLHKADTARPHPKMAAASQYVAAVSAAMSTRHATIRAAAEKHATFIAMSLDREDRSEQEA